MKKDLTLVILAAGMGSRFGGLKQIEPIGPNGEFIIDYSVYDAVRSGFTKVVFVIKEENYDVFKETIGKRVDSHINVEYAFQKLDDLPSGYSVPEGREKPWGTSHAVLAARGHVNSNFVIINADDFYGYDAFKVIADFLKKEEESSKERFALVGYEVANTMSENGSVKRGACYEQDGYLTSIIESSIENIDGKIIAKPLDGRDSFEMKSNDLVSMNMLGFTSFIFKYIEDNFKDFLDKNIDNLKSEYLIPDSLFECIEKQLATVKVLHTSAKWYGVTYKEDKDYVVKSIKELVEKGEYPNNLWS